MAQYNLPYHAQIPEHEYRMADHYHDNRMTSPSELGGWMDQSDGGGKFQLKRRRRCGQCGPCLVKENCNKCQYCLRKDVLKQACIHRKCIYLRKPASHHRPEISNGNTITSEKDRTKDVGSGGGGRSSSCSSTNQDSPHKPLSSTPSALTAPNTKPVPVNPSAVAAAAAVVQTAELSSCQVAKTSFAVPASKPVADPLRANSLPLNKGAGDPRASALEQHQNALLDAVGMLDPCRRSCMSGARGLDPGRGPAQVLGPGTNNADCGFGMGNSIAASPAYSVSKDFSLPQREQFRSPMDQWGAVPYGYSHPNPWAPPTVSYGVQSNGSYYTNPLGSSCQLGMSNPTNHFAAPSQPSFHHNVPFAHPDFSTHANFHASAPAMQSTMTAPFYSPATHIPPALPNFPSFSQLPSSAGPHGHGAYTAAHPPMYPGSFYSSFRPPYEPQIYHVQLPAPTTPFSQPHGGLSGCVSSFGYNHLADKHSETDQDNETDKHIESDRHNETDEHNHLSDKHSETDQRNETDKRNKRGTHNEESMVENERSVQKPFIFPSSKKCTCDMNSSDGACTKHKHVQGDVTDPSSMTETKSGHRHLTTQDAATSSIDDLLQQLTEISGRKHCNAVNCDDFKMLADIRSDECMDHEHEMTSDTLHSIFIKASINLSSIDAREFNSGHRKMCQENKTYDHTRSRLHISPRYKKCATDCRSHDVVQCERGSHVNSQTCTSEKQTISRLTPLSRHQTVMQKDITWHGTDTSCAGLKPGGLRPQVVEDNSVSVKDVAVSWTGEEGVKGLEVTDRSDSNESCVESKDSIEHEGNGVTSPSPHSVFCLRHVESFSSDSEPVSDCEESSPDDSDFKPDGKL